MKNIFVFIVLCSFASLSSAGRETGKVQFQLGQYGSNSSSAGKMFFFLSGAKTESPSCATQSGGERWVIDNNWPGSQMQLSILLAAFMSDRDVEIRGANNCGVHGDTETAQDIIIK